MPRVLLLLYPGCIPFEAVAACEFLPEGWEVEVASPTGEPIRTRQGMRYLADLGYPEVAAERYAGALIPGGDYASVYGSEAVTRVLRDLHAAGAVLGAICAGPFLLAQAGLLAGARYVHATCYPREAEPLFAEGTFLREPVVVSGQLVTALPEAQLAFAAAFAERVGALDAESAARLLSYQRGELPRDWEALGPVDLP